MKVTINEKEYGLQWGLGAIEIYTEAMEIATGTSLGMEEALDLAIMKNKDQFKALINLALAGFQNYAEINDLSFDLNYRKLQAWVSDADQAEWDAVIDNFKKSRFLGRTVEEALGMLPVAEGAGKAKKKSSLGK